MARPGNNPKRRIAREGFLTDERKAELAVNARYGGSGHHKRNPADYGLGSVWIQDSHPGLVVIQAWDGPIRSD